MRLSAEVMPEHFRKLNHASKLTLSRRFEASNILVERIIIQNFGTFVFKDFAPGLPCWKRASSLFCVAYSDWLLDGILTDTIQSSSSIN